MEVDGNQDLSGSAAKQESLPSRNGRRLAVNNAKHVLRKRQAFGLRRDDKDIYVNNQTNFKVPLSPENITFSSPHKNCTCFISNRYTCIGCFGILFLNRSVTISKGQLYKCEKLFDKGASELVIHGLGAAVYKACNLALRLKEIHYGTLELDIKTSTVTLVGRYICSIFQKLRILINIERCVRICGYLLLTDNLEALDDDAEDEVSSRQNSAVHIRVFRTLPVPKLRQTD